MMIAISDPVLPAIFSNRHYLPRTIQLHNQNLIHAVSTFRRGAWIIRASHPNRPIQHREQMWLTCFHFSWKCFFSRLVSFYLLLSLNLVAVASEYPTPSTYSCEDVANYYSPLKHFRLKGEKLKRKLNSIIAPHHSLSYQEVWDALKVLDAADIDKPEASLGIVEIYSLRVVPKWLSGKPEGWNREHLWPRSYGLTTVPSLTDLHNIRPADVNVNSSRGNKYYGECITGSTKCLRPANKEAALDTEADKRRWAPPKEVRGDIARALMYMAVCYGFPQPGGSPGLRLSDTPNVGRKQRDGTAFHIIRME
ncbi:extracellular ribonuclease isoform X3 [Medicago truncatula]|uniref:extracellular ribonuclease isoform X3 n=1 Tax=Medicago truncatula TaxID=3880 RepID=UPI000D2F3331|nr:extracellular ribonuclease isoform X3 [Medicago truncatula]